MRKVYISGKITGLSRTEYMTKFNKAEEYLKTKGYEVINPARTNGTLPEDTTYDQYMDMSMLMISMCDTIYLLDNWKDSNGARKEAEYAYMHDMEVLFEDVERRINEKIKKCTAEKEN